MPEVQLTGHCFSTQARADSLLFVAIEEAINADLGPGNRRLRKELTEDILQQLKDRLDAEPIYADIADHENSLRAA